MLSSPRLLLSLVSCFCLATLAGAEVERVEIQSRELVLGGEAFPEAGAYVKLTGTIHFTFDPANPFNRGIADLEHAPRNAEGLVEAWGDLMVLRPVDDSKSSRIGLIEVCNRGGKAALRYFNRASASADPSEKAHFGDGFLMRRGLTLIWIGWQFDVPEDPERMRLHVPVATGAAGAPIDGLARSDWTVDEAVETLPLGHRDHIAYPVSDPDYSGNVLSMRNGRLAERQLVPRERWSFSRKGAEGETVASGTHITLAGGFEAGKIYELVYRAEGPAVVGLGLAAIRDTVSYAKYSSECPFRVQQAVGLGISQTGRFLRHFLYQGFNTDERSRKAFDGMLVHSAGAGRGSFNHRFAQPSRDAHRYSAFFYPTDVFPFSGRTQRDPTSGQRRGLLALARRRGNVPKIFYTNTGYEYWGRAASLLHTSLDGSADVVPLPEERIYHLASTQHFPVPFPPREEWKHADADVWRGNPIDFLITERALLDALFNWVREGTAPPPSTFPRIDDSTLGPIAELSFPSVPGAPPPAVAHEAYRVDYGKDFDVGRIAVQPPGLGAAFQTLVPRVDEFGNERGGVPTLETLVPLATFAPWHVRRGMAGGNGELTDFFGTYVPLPRTDSERTRTEDGRPSIEATYGSKEAYLTLAQESARALIDQRFLLVEDLPRVLERARAHWDWIHAND